MKVIVVSFMVVWSAAAVFLMSYGILYSFPDYVHVSYGFPFVYAVHALSSIAGPVDTWSVNVILLAADLFFWMISEAVIVFVLINRFEKKVKVGSVENLGDKM